MPFNFNVFRFNKMTPLRAVSFVEVLKGKLITYYQHKQHKQSYLDLSIDYC